VAVKAVDEAVVAGEDEVKDVDKGAGQDEDGVKPTSDDPRNRARTTTM